jgi:hypothetical protein
MSYLSILSSSSSVSGIGESFLRRDLMLIDVWEREMKRTLWRRFTSTSDAADDMCTLHALDDRSEAAASE